ncbi:MAG: hypothetical protein H0V56_01070 [Chthoniobacterales bacterium]|nr:hypothetical protein [Chthoniobacterales bacterium]
MTHLFDTNAWIRAIERPEELTAPASTIIQAAGSAPFGLSAISIYEIGQKVPVQHLTSNHLDPVARVTICTIQRLYAMLRGFSFG